ncbi:hypothetical protein OXIME_000641 [Oxyplasma meridianum]|uniref:Uncharacterized protein n=1 Tax=Oxyplasma meridianum TaxID=3073602 RepID=A0AAX4NFI9_9ARCH
MMNRKLMLIMVAAVATILPAVAVADVMIAGSVAGHDVQAKDSFIVQPGWNYLAANKSAGFGWISHMVNSNEVLGNISLGVMTNETIYEINVLDINFTTTGSFNITVSTSTPLPQSTVLYISNAPFSFVNGVISTTGAEHSFELNKSSTQTTIGYYVSPTITL